MTVASSSLSVWLAATRPRTLAAGVAPVLVGTALGGTVQPINWLAAAACLIGAVLIQIGSNFANDAFDGLKGADTPDRIGPQRAVASGLISARAMLIATGIVLALALLVGLYLTTIGGWPILALGIISLVCAVAYTGGPFPLAYHGLGDVFVLLFFGLFAVLGSAWVQVAPALTVLGPYQSIGDEPWGFTNLRDSVGLGLTILDLHFFWWLIATAVGLQATGIIAVNNLRDRVTDAAVNKRTLAVRLGDRGTRLYIVMLHVGATTALGLATVLTGHLALLLPTAVAGCGGWILCRGLFHTTGPALNQYLGRSALLELVTAVFLTIALMLYVCTSA